MYTSSLSFTVLKLFRPIYFHYEFSSSEDVSMEDNYNSPACMAYKMLFMVENISIFQGFQHNIDNNWFGWTELTSYHTK